MGTKTLQVSDEDERVWRGLEGRADGTDGSVSRIVTDALRAYLDAEREADEAREVMIGLSKADQTTLIDRLRQLLRRYGRDRLAVAYSRACHREGAARRRAKVRADAAAGPGAGGNGTQTRVEANHAPIVAGPQDVRSAIVEPADSPLQGDRG